MNTMKRYRRALLSALLLFGLVFIVGAPVTASAAGIQDDAEKACQRKYSANDPASQQNRAACVVGTVADKKGKGVKSACTDKDLKLVDAPLIACLKGGGWSQSDAQKVADDVNKANGAGTGSTGGTGSVDVDSSQFDTGLPQTNAGTGQIQNILAIAFGIFGALAVLMIVTAGLRFVTAQGNPQEVAKARGTIAYAIAGLLIAISAEAIVALVAHRL